jgi:hypothetical protein
MRFKSLISDLLVEAKKQDVIEKTFGFSKEWADQFVAINEKLSVWIASSFLDYQAKVYKKPKKEMVDILNKVLTPTKMVNWSREGETYVQKYNYIIDWLRNVNINGQVNVNIKDLSFEDAFAQSEEWHESLESQKDQNYQEKHEIVIDYRDDNGFGYYWANLDVSYSKEESDRMGHCGNKAGTTLFSLRRIHPNGDGESYITAARQTKDDLLSEIHGKKNSKPKPIYYKYIIDLILNDKYPVKGLTLRGVYKPQNNFTLGDLTQEQLDYIFERNSDVKFHYVFGDGTIVKGSDINNPQVSLVEKDGSYGLADTKNIEVIKPFNYKIDSNNELSEFISTPGMLYLIKVYKSKVNNDEFITLQEFKQEQGENYRRFFKPNENNRQSFKLISPEDAREIIKKGNN